jgi:putative pre-16S rRNA nuclease
MTRIIGLDPGESRIGVAVSDPTGTIASPIGFVDVRQDDVVLTVRALCEEYETTFVVIGLPLRLDGSEGPAAERSHQLGATLIEALGVEVRYADERFTTVTAEKALLEGNMTRSKRKTKRDQVAAAVMLQNHLDAMRRIDERRLDGGHRDDPPHDR